MSAQSTTPSPLRGPRRIVTAHAELPSELQSELNAEPAVVVSFDSSLEQIPELGGLAQHSYAWMHHALPADNTSPMTEDPAEQAELINKQGLPRPAVVVRYNELAPDYNVFLVGEAELVIPSAAYRSPTFTTHISRVTCQPGDICIQRGTMHGWHNPSTTHWARWVTVAVVAETIKLKDGQTLDKVFWPQWSGVEGE